MATPAQKSLKEFITSLKWADEMFLAANTADDVDINAVVNECRRVLQARRNDTLCSVVDAEGYPCNLSKMHGATPHRFDRR